MPCEHFQDALTEAAATGAGPQGELRAHLKNCAACQAAFEQQQSLFASIDSGMRVVANAEVPASLLPRVRARLDEMAAPLPAWAPKWFVLAGAGAMLAFLFITQTLWRTAIGRNRTESATNATQSWPPAHRPPKEIPDMTTATHPGGVVHHTHADGEKISPENSFLKREAQPEVLVPRDQEVLLVRYGEDWRRRKPAPIVVTDSGDFTLTPLQVAPIQIAELDVKLLAESQSQ